MGKRLLSVISAGLWLSSARAAGPLPDPSSLPDLNALGNIAAELVKVVGIAFDHRPYQPATPLGTSAGVDLSLEATVSKVPQSFKDALSSAGFGSAANLPMLPSPKLHIHKGIGEMVDIGGSLIAYQGYKVYGADMKVALTDPTLEGPLLAARLSYNYANLSYVKATTWTPQLLISRKMEFADPYLGVGVQFVSGEVAYEQSTGIPEGLGLPTSITFGGSGTGTAFNSFFGVSFRPPNVGLKVVIEGSYNSASAHTMGTKIGFGF